MARLTLHKPVTYDEMALAACAHNGQSAIIEGREPAYTFTSFHACIHRTFEHVKVLAVATNREACSPSYGMYEVRLDPLDAATLDVREWCDGSAPGWRVLDDGTLRCTAFLINFGASTHPGRRMYPKAWGDVLYSEPLCELSIRAEIDGEVPLDLRCTKYGSPADVRGSAVFDLSLGSLRGSFTDTRYQIGVLTEGVLHGTDNPWDVLRDYWKHKGYYLDDHGCAKLAGLGSSDAARRALGIPVKEEEWDHLLAVDAPPKPAGHRVLDIDDILTSQGPNKGAVGTFPETVQGPPLVRWVREEVQRYSSRRSMTRIQYSAVITEVDPIVFGLTRNHADLKLLDLNEARKEYPVLRPTEEYDWGHPVAQLLVARSPLGWHGLFMLPVTMEIESRKSPRALFAYLVPVFMSHEETVHVTGRYRYLPADVIDAIRESHGLANFLQHALNSLAGAKVKARKAGYDLDGLLPYGKLALPRGHMLRTWGAACTYEPLGVTAYGYGSSGKPAKGRACVEVGNLLGWTRGVGHVPFGLQPVAANDVAPAPAAPQVTKRVLEI